MARRSDGRFAIALDGLGDAFVRVACAIVLDALAFIIWNVGTRPPLQLIDDIRHGLRDRRALLVGSASAVVGFLFVMAATVALLPAVVDRAHDLTLAELVTFLVALGIELLVGDDVRALAGLGRKR